MGQEQGYTNHDDFQVLEFYWSFYKSKAHLSDRIDRECTFQIQTSTSLSISAQGFLRMNIDLRVNSTILNLSPLNTRISYEWLFQNLRAKYVSLSNGTCQMEEMHINT